MALSTTTLVYSGLALLLTYLVKKILQSGSRESFLPPGVGIINTSPQTLASDMPPSQKPFPSSAIFISFHLLMLMYK